VLAVEDTYLISVPHCRERSRVAALVWMAGSRGDPERGAQVREGGLPGDAQQHIQRPFWLSKLEEQDGVSAHVNPDAAQKTYLRSNHRSVLGGGDPEDAPKSQVTAVDHKP